MYQHISKRSPLLIIAVLIGNAMRSVRNVMGLLESEDKCKLIATFLVSWFRITNDLT